MECDAEVGAPTGGLLGETTVDGKCFYQQNLDIHIATKFLLTTQNEMETLRKELKIVKF